MNSDFDGMCKCGEFIKELSSSRNGSTDFFTELKGNFYFLPISYDQMKQVEQVSQANQSPKKGGGEE